MSSAPQAEIPDILAIVRDRVFRFAASRMSREDADDMAQTVMTIMYQKYRDVTNPDQAMAIATGILTRVRIGWYRKRLRRGEDRNEQVDVLPLADERDTPERAAARKRAAHQVHSAIAALDERCQKVIRLSLEGFGGREISTFLKMPSPNAADLALSRCRAKLRQTLHPGLLEEI
jgi:RNA polymerase sigma factor (sigma-70 family)